MFIILLFFFKFRGNLMFIILLFFSDKADSLKLNSHL